MSASQSLWFVSGQVAGYTLYSELDCYGSDIRDLRSREAADCGWHCTYNDNCVAFATGYPYYCWLKWECNLTSFEPHTNRFTYIKNGKNFRSHIQKLFHGILLDFYDFYFFFQKNKKYIHHYKFQSMWYSKMTIIRLH